MAVESGMFLFELILQKVQTLSEGRAFVIKSDFADVFSLELKDPKSMNIQIPEPPPLPPEKPGKKKKAKPKKKKKGKEPPPPPEPVIQAGQSVLFTSTPEFLIQTMKTSPLSLNVWTKEDRLSLIGTTLIPWDAQFFAYLEKICKCEYPPPTTVSEEYMIFNEEKPMRLATIELLIKLTYLKDRITLCFRTLTEDPLNKKYMYTGVNTKSTSYMCSMKTTDENYLANSNKILNTSAKDKMTKKIAFADCKNAPGANLTFFRDGDYCCFSHADKPPESIYKAPETCPSIDTIIDYVRKIIVSCNDNIRMLTPRPTIKPRAKATDIDRLCYCQETNWPEGEFAKRFKQENQKGPCALCSKVATKKEEGVLGNTFDVANLRGPCGRPDCRIARDLRAYIENLVEEDMEEVKLDDIVGPCGSKTCLLAEKIQEFLCHQGPFTHDANKEALSTQCDCVATMQKALLEKKKICDDECMEECSEVTSTSSDDGTALCGGTACPWTRGKCPKKNTEYQVYYFTVEYDNLSKSSSNTTATTDKTAKNSDISEKTSDKSDKTSNTSDRTSDKTDKTSEKSDKTSDKSAKTTDKSDKSSDKSGKTTDKGGKSSASSKTSTIKEESTIKTDDRCQHPAFMNCHPDCPTARQARFADNTCSATCIKNVHIKENEDDSRKPCESPVCPRKRGEDDISPEDSQIELKLADIHNLCCVDTCDVADTVKGFVVDGYMKLKSKSPLVIPDKDPCYCDCVCNLHFTKKTTYCNVCGGYECLGEDLKNTPAFAMPYPCPVYHKLYDKRYIKVKSPWPGEDDKLPAKKTETGSTKSKGSTRQTSSKDVLESRASRASKADGDKKRKSTTADGEKKRKSTSADGDKKNKSASAKGKSKPQPEPKQKKSKASTDVKSEVKALAPAEKPPISKYKQLPYPKVPKNMGWAWDADDIPALKVRPHWKPGCCHKLLARKYRSMREGMDVIMRKKRALLNRKKKLEMKPTLIVKKVDGEYTVQMEVFKKFSKERILNQYPFDEKPPLCYSIGKTDEEKRRIQNIRDKRKRREDRRKSQIIQSAFRDRCQEICVKAYDQAIGVLPLPDPDCPECPCQISEESVSTPIDSCSCSDEADYSSSDTDGDDWTVEFYAPCSRWNTKEKTPPTTAENETQYTYLDYKVKLVDKKGQQAPRFFIGPDGKQECSDLGGFWGPGHEWMEINKDGYIGPDNRWVPANFYGPDGQNYSSEEPTFTDANGHLIRIGIDGYIGPDLKWCWYKPRLTAKSKSTLASQKPKPKDAKDAAKFKEIKDKEIKETKSKPTSAGKKPALAPGSVKPSKSVTIGRKTKSPLVLNLEYQGQYTPTWQPSDHYRLDPRKLAKYNEIMRDLEMYDLSELKMPRKASRASNTSEKQCSRDSIIKYTNKRMMGYPSFMRNRMSVIAEPSLQRSDDSSRSYY